MVGAELAEVVLHQGAQLARGGLQGGGAVRPQHRADLGRDQ